MRIFKRGLAMLLALLMLTMSFPTGVLADVFEQYVPLTLDEGNYFWAGGAMPQEATFTPSESGMYTFRSLHFIDADFTLHNSAGSQLAEDDPFNRSFNITHYLEAGETYYLRADWGDEYTNGRIDLVVSRCAVEAIDFDDLKIVEGYNCSSTSYNDPVTGEYVTYRLYDYTPTYTVELSDGTSMKAEGETFEIDGIEYQIRFTDDQVNHVNSWEIGEHMVETDFYGMSDAFTVEIVDCPVVSVDVETTDKIENVHGCSRSDTVQDPETGEWYETEEYFVYDSEPEKYIITMNDGEVIEASGYNPWFEWYGVSYAIDTVSDGQSFDNQWGVGENSVTATVMGFEFEFTVNVVETIIESFVVYDVDVIEDVDVTVESDWTEDPDLGQWIEKRYLKYDAAPRRYTITLKDGSVYENQGFWYEGRWYEPQLVGGQSYENQWQVDHVYRQDVTIMGYPASYSVYVIENPIASIEVEEITTLQGTNGSLTGEWVTDPATGEESYEEYFEYDVKFDVAKLIMKNGDVVELPIEYGSFTYNNKRYSVTYFDSQSYENQWGVGEHTQRAHMLGVDFEYTVKVIDSPIVSVDISNIIVIEGVDGYDTNPYDPENNFFYYPVEPQVQSIVLRDGTVVEGQSYIEFNGEQHYLGWTNTQDLGNPWGVGEHVLSYNIAGFKGTFTVNVIENPIASIEADEVPTNLEGHNGYWTSDPLYDDENNYIGESEQYWYYENTIPQTFTVTFKDGTTTSMSNYIELNGRAYWMFIDGAQSHENQWGVGTYTMTGNVVGVEFSYPVVVEPTPVVSVEIAPIVLREFLDGETTTSSLWDENGDYIGESESWYRYYISAFDYTITLRDGSVYQNEGFYYNGSWFELSYSNPQSYDNQWGVGDHAVPFSVAGYEGTFTVTVGASPIDRIEFHGSVNLVEKLHGGMCTDSLWGENGDYLGESEQYWRYDIPSDQLMYTVYTKDGIIGVDGNSGFEYNGEWYELSASSNQAHDNVWGVGDHEFTVTVVGKTYTLPVNVIKNPVVSVEVESVKLIQNENGCYTTSGLWDENGNYIGESEEWFCYSLPMLDVTITLDDGTVTHDNWVEINGVEYGIHYDETQDYYHQWGVGPHVIKGRIANVEFEFTAEVIETPVASVEAQPLVFVEHAGGWWRQDSIWDENGNYVGEGELYYHYDIPIPEITVTMKDGTTFDQGYVEFNGAEYWLQTSGLQQSAENALSVGTYEVDATIAGYAFTYTVEIIDSPIASVEIEKMHVVQNTQGYWTTDSIYDEHGNYIGESGKYFYYFTNPYNITVTMKDGTVFEGETVEWNGNWYGFNYDASGQTYDEPWGVGVHELTGSVLGYNFTYEIEIVETPIASIEVSDRYYKVGDGYWDGDHYFDEELGEYVSTPEYCHYEYYPYGVRYTLIDGSVVTNPSGFSYGGQWFSLSLSILEGEQSYENQWGVGTYHVQGMIANRIFAYNVHIVEPQRNDTYEYILAGDRAIITNCFVQPETLTIPETIDGVSVREVHWLGGNNTTTKRVVFPDSVESIEDSAIVGLTAIETVHFGSGVKRLSTHMFEKAANLKAITLSEDNQNYRIIDGGLYDAQGKTLVAFPPAYDGIAVLPNTVENFDVLLYGGNMYNNLSVIFADGHPDYVSIGLVTYTRDMSRVVFAAKGLGGSYTMPDSVTEMDSQAFYNIKGLTDVIVSSQVTSITYATFANCDNLKSVTLPSGLIGIDGRAFYSDVSLTDIIIPNSVEYIGAEAFENTGLTSVVIPGSVQEIGYRAFYGSNKLAKIVIPNHIEIIGRNAFAHTKWYNAQQDGAVYLQHVLLGYKGEMPANATVTVKDGVKVIANGAFFGQENLTKVNLPEGLVHIGSEAFARCRNLTELVVPSTVTYIDYDAFWGSAVETLWFTDKEQRDEFADWFEGDIECKLIELKITTQPKTTYAKDGATAKLTVSAKGDGLKYAWYIKNAGATKYTKSSVTSNTYSVTMSDTAKGRYAYCVVTDKYGNTVQSNTVQLRMAATIATQPKTTYAKDGATAKLTVSAKGDGLKYAWYIKNAGASKYTKSSVTSSSYSVTMGDATKGRYAYCVVTDKYGYTVQSNTVQLRMAATITTDPKTTYTKSGSTAKLTVSAKGDGLKYAWYIKNAGASKFTKSSVTSSSYSTTMNSTSKDRQVYCVVTDKYGKTVTSKTVTLRMAATITTDLKTTYTKSGSTAKLSVTAVGDGLKYAWYIKNAGASKFTKSSVTSSSYSTTMNSTSKDRQVYCVVTDKYGKTVTSKTVTLRMAATITTNLKTTYTQSGSKASLTIKATGDGLKYTWYTKNYGASKFTKSSVTSSSYSTTMNSTSKDRQVYCVVTDKYGNTVQSATAVLRMVVKITTQPKSQSATLNGSVKFTVSAAGDGLKYKWQVKTSSSGSWTTCKDQGNATKTLTVSATKARNGYQYRCVVSDKYGYAVNSSAVKLTVVSPKITTQPKAASVKSGSKATFTVKATGNGLSYRWQVKKPGSSSWTNIPASGYSGAKTKTLTVTSTKGKNGYQYRVRVYDEKNNTVTSSAVKLKVK